MQDITKTENQPRSEWKIFESYRDDIVCTVSKACKELLLKFKSFLKNLELLIETVAVNGNQASCVCKFKKVGTKIAYRFYKKLVEIKLATFCCCATTRLLRKNFNMLNLPLLFYPFSDGDVS